MADGSSQTVDKEALRLLLYAQKFYPKEYANFTSALETRKIPWDITNKDFVSLLDGFKTQFSSFLSAMETPVDQAAIEKTVPTKEVLEPLVEELEQIKSAQQEGVVFQNNKTKVDAYIKNIKKSFAKETTKTATETIISDVAPKLIQAAAFYSDQTDLPTDSQGFPEIPKGFFAAIAQSPAQKIISGVLDALPHNARVDIIQSALGKAYETIKEKTDKLGTTIAQSEEVKRTLSQMNASSFQQPGTRLTPNNALFSFFSDVYSSVFVDPQLIAVWYAAYQQKQVQTSWSQMSAIALSLSGATVKGVARTAVKKTGEKVIVSTFGKSLGAWLGTLIGPGPGTFLGWLIGDLVVDKFFSLVSRGFSGLFNLISLKFLTDLFNGNADPGKDKGLVWLLVGGGILLFTVLFPVAIPGFDANFQQLVDDNAYVRGLGGGDEIGGPALDCLGTDKDKPECDLTPCDSTKQDCRWPTYGFVVQGPATNTNCPGTHPGVQAIDIDPFGGERPSVYATVDGTVAAFFGCETDTGCLDTKCSCANYVKITGANYTVGYWHLANIQMVKTGQSVKVGDVIGILDHTGYSSGPHLHYQYWGPGSINSILPVAVPTCNNFSSASCPCPNITTGVAL
jgi:hypothetical protein